VALRNSAQQTAVLDGQAEPVRRRFGRLQPPQATVPAQTLEGRFKLRIPSPAAAAGTLPEAPPVLPFDSTKIFVGPNGTYYDERWRWMEWRGRNRSWNWAAALTLGAWLAYRRLYWAAAISLVWIGALVLMLLNGVFPPLVAAGQLAVAIAIGLFGNRLYQVSFRRAALQVAKQHEEYAARVAALAGRGGVDPRAVWLWASSAVGLAGLLLGLDR
jgi:hypothetical protein